MKKLTLFLVFILFVSGCSNYGEDVNSSEKPEQLRILYHQGYRLDAETYNGIAMIRHVGRYYDSATGIEIVCEELEANTVEDYAQKLTTMMLEGTAPDMFILTNNQGSLDLNDLIKGGVILELSDELENYDQLIEGAKNGYYVPCSYMSWGVNLQVEELEHLGYGDIESVTDEMVFKDIYLKWLLHRRPELNIVHYSRLMDMFEYETKAFIDFEEHFDLTNPEMRAKIIEYSNYVKSSEYFTHKLGIKTDTLKKQVFDWESRHYQEAMERHRNSLDTYVVKERYGWFNQYSMKGLKRTFEEKNVPYAAPGKHFSTSGLVVNKNSKYKDYCIDFIDYMISEQIQNQIGDHYSLATRAANGLVNEKSMERQIEADKVVYPEKYTKVKEADYKRVRDGEVEMVATNSNAKSRYNQEMYSIVFDYAFGEIDSEDELVDRLRKLSSEVFMMVHE